jgi:two-component system, response regulator PdtaR
MDTVRQSAPAPAAYEVLVVEDEVLVAMELEDLLIEEGFKVLGPAATVQEAINILGTASPDVAVLDMKLRGELVTPVVEVLTQRGVPFLLASGSPAADLGLPDLAKDIINVGKPLQPKQLLHSLAQLLQHPPLSHST